MSPNARADLMFICRVMMQTYRASGHPVHALTLISGRFEWALWRDETVPDGAELTINLSVHQWWALLSANEVEPMARRLALSVFGPVPAHV